MLEFINNNDPEAAPFFAIPAGPGIAEPFPGPLGTGGHFVVFNSELRLQPLPSPPVFGPTGAIFTHPNLGTHYVYGNIFQRYEFRYHFCFGHLGAHLGYPIGNQIFDQEVNFHVQRFEHGFIFIEEADTDNSCNEFPPIRSEDGFVWKP